MGTEPEVVTGILSIGRKDAYVLFDSGSTHSFASPNFIMSTSLPSQGLEMELAVKTPTGGTLIASEVIKDCPILIKDKTLKVDLVTLPIRDFDVILGMDWLTSNHAKIDFYKKEVRFNLPGQTPIVFFQDGWRTEEASQPPRGWRTGDASLEYGGSRTKETTQPL